MHAYTYTCLNTVKSVFFNKKHAKKNLDIHVV